MQKFRAHPYPNRNSELGPFAPEALARCRRGRPYFTRGIKGLSIARSLVFSGLGVAERNDKQAFACGPDRSLRP